MREILFRGKTIDTNDWVEGYYSEFPIPSLGCMFAAGTSEYIACEDTRPYIVKIITKQHPYFSNAEPMQVCEHEQYEIIPETVGQYTGLTDKNGNKIFENDIIEVDDKKRTEIIWDTGKYNQIVGFRLKKYPIFGLNLYNCKIMKVIGNIHDNSELLEEKQNVI